MPKDIYLYASLRGVDLFFPPINIYKSNIYKSIFRDRSEALTFFFFCSPGPGERTAEFNLYIYILSFSIVYINISLGIASKRGPGERAAEFKCDGPFAAKFKKIKRREWSFEFKRPDALEFRAGVAGDDVVRQCVVVS